MSESQKKPGWVFWAVLFFVGLPILYVASFGPACWISSRMNLGASAVTAIYRPLWPYTRRAGCPLWDKTLWDQYAEAGAANDWNWVLNLSYAPTPNGEPFEEHWDWQHGRGRYSGAIVRVKQRR